MGNHLWHTCSSTRGRGQRKCFASLAASSDSLWPHGVQHARPPCPSPTPRVYSNSCPSSQWCYPTISFSVIPLSSYLQSCPASGSVLMNWFFVSGDQSIGTSASVLPMNIQGWFSLGWTSLVSLQSKGLSRVFSSTTVQKHQSLLKTYQLLPKRIKTFTMPPTSFQVPLHLVPFVPVMQAFWFLK